MSARWSHERKVDDGIVHKLIAVSLEVTARCNQRCLYCYNRDRGSCLPIEDDGPTYRMFDIVDRILDQTDLYQVTLTGGEPLLRRDILEIIDHIRARGPKVCMISNAIAVDQTMARELAKRAISYVQTTLVGASEETHDPIAGTGSFSRRVSGIKHLVAAGVPVGGAFICTRENYAETETTMRLLHGLGAHAHMCFMCFSPAGYSIQHMAQLLPTRRQVADALRQANRFAEATGRMVHNKIPIPPCQIDQRQYPHVVFSLCGAGQNGGECFVDHKGNVRFCGPQRDHLGNVLQTELRYILTEAASRAYRRTPEFCRTCAIVGQCAGGCPAAAQWTARSKLWSGCVQESQTTAGNTESHELPRQLRIGEQARLAK